MDTKAAFSSEQWIANLNWRYATKKFDPTKKIPSDTWAALEKSIMLSPSSYGLQPWKFLVIQNSELRKQLAPVTYNQPQVEQCSQFVVLCAKKRLTISDIDYFINEISKTRGVPHSELQDFSAMMKGTIQSKTDAELEAWNTRQVYIALGTLLTSAAALGIDACPMEGFDPTAYSKILDLDSTNFKPIVLCALGYRDSKDWLANAKKVRFDRSQVLETR